LKKYLNMEIPLAQNCSVIGVDEELELLAIEKGIGTLTHPNGSTPIKKGQKALLNAKYDFEQEAYYWNNPEGDPRKAYLVHRLDSHTSGIILIALREETARTVKSLFAHTKVKKKYLAVVHSHSSKYDGRWADRLIETKKNGRLRVRWSNSGHQAIAEMKTLKSSGSSPNLSLIELTPKTGRTHQLRVQCAKRKIPIIGDKTYGDFSANRKIEKQYKLDRLCLHASEIYLEIKLKNGDLKKLHYESPLPRAMGRIIH
jgi:tRNA pseudouridine65 synthase